MENKTEGLDLRELEAQHAELLPDRVEMGRRRRVRFGDVTVGDITGGTFTVGDVSIDFFS